MPVSFKLKVHDVFLAPIMNKAKTNLSDFAAMKCIFLMITRYLANSSRGHWPWPYYLGFRISCALFMIINRHLFYYIVIIIALFAIKICNLYYNILQWLLSPQSWLSIKRYSLQYAIIIRILVITMIREGYSRIDLFQLCPVPFLQFMLTSIRNIGIANYN